MQIKKLTYDDLIRKDAENENHGSGIIYVRDLDSSQLRSYDIPLRLEFFTLVFCRKGQTSFSVNTRQYIIKENDLFINTPQNILSQGEFSPETRCDILLISLDFLRKTNFMSLSVNMPAYMLLREKPVLSLSEQERKSLSVIENINTAIQDNEPNADRMRGMLVGIFLLKLENIIKTRCDEAPVHAFQPHSRQDELLGKFLELLAMHHKEQRSISFYANELYVTPKYFSTVIKKISGQSPVDWINDCVIREAKAMLRFSSMSVQEIAYNLNFSSQTFFGKYFKRLTGITPGEFRAQNPN
ncbi:MAG: helix-turn-helix domain-containing protein [Bacteroidaceae bacterium]|jgi:AraC family transcriptional activator of pobA